MKKASYILLAMVLIAALFVSCKAEVIDDSDLLVNVTFSSDDNSKGLTWSRDFDPENYFWSYDAAKADNGPRTGTATKEKVGGDAGIGLKHDVGPFSIGTWSFILYGYKDAGRTELVYEGTAQASLTKTNNSSVKVHVSSKAEKTGTILISNDIKLTDGTNAEYVPTHVTIRNAKDSSVANDVNNRGLGNIPFSTSEAMSYEVNSGSYVVTIEMRNEDGSVVYSSTQIYINVYDYQTTKIGGSLDDVKTSTRFEAEDGTIIGTSAETTIETSGSTTLTVAGVTPINSGDTTVEFPQGALGNDGSKATLQVVAYPTSVISKKFGISGNNSPLAGIDLSVFVGGNEVTEFESAVTVTTYVAKGLTSKVIEDENAASDAANEGLQVVYNGDGKQPTIVYYNPTSGELRFSTTHFSLYYVTSSKALVVNISKNESYRRSLSDSVSRAADGDTLVVLTDIISSSLVNLKDGKSLVIDLNGHSISNSKTDKAYLFSVCNAKVEFVGRGTIENPNTSESSLGAIKIVGGTGEIEKGYSSVTVGEGIVLKGRSGIYIGGTASNATASNGVSVYVKGSIESSGDAIYLNGSLTEDKNNVPNIILDKASIHGESHGIYAAGYGEWEIKNSSITGGNTAIEIRAGKMTIKGGTFTANATEYSCVANGNGTTTTGAAIAVAQHDTKLPINVTISGGTFSGYHALSVMNPQKNEYDAIKEINVNVIGGEFASTEENKDIEAVNYSSEFIKIDNGSSFTIRARKDGDEGNVTSLSDGRFFSSLQGAVDGVKDGSTVSLTLLNRVENGDGLLVKEGRKLNLTIDFNGKTYSAFASDTSQKYDYINAFEFGKGNTIELKNGTLTTAQKYNVTLIKNYSDLTLDCFTIEGYRSDDSLSAVSSLSCNYGTTLVTGNTMITGNSVYNSNALEVCYLLADEYKNGVSVHFDNSFSGKVSGAVYFNLESDNDTSDYSHELVIESGDFSEAQFILPYAGNSSSFKASKEAIGEELTFIGNNYPVREKEGYWILDRSKAVVLNKTTGVIYEELERALNNAKSGDEFVLLSNCILTGYPIKLYQKTVTIDLDGKTVAVADSFTDEGFMISVESGTLVVNDSRSKGSIDATANEKRTIGVAIKAIKKATITINGGIIKGTTSAVEKNADSTSNSKYNSTIKINGGTFNSDPTAYVDSSTHTVTNNSNGTWTVSSKN